MLKKPGVTTITNNQHVKGSETLLKYAWQNFGHTFWSFRKKISSKISVLGISKILRLFGNTLTPNEKYSLSVKACLTEPIQVQLSGNQKIFSQFFSAYPKPT